MGRPLIVKVSKVRSWNAGSGDCGAPVHHRYSSRVPFVIEKSPVCTHYLHNKNYTDSYTALQIKKKYLLEEHVI